MRQRRFGVGMLGRERERGHRAAAPGAGQVKLSRVASGSARQHSRRAAESTASVVSSPTTVIRPPIRNCSCVTGKYQQTSTQDDFARSASLELRRSVTNVNWDVSFKKPRNTSVRLAGRPSGARSPFARTATPAPGDSGKSPEPGRDSKVSAASVHSGRHRCGEISGSRLTRSCHRRIWYHKLTVMADPATNGRRWRSTGPGANVSKHGSATPDRKEHRQDSMIARYGRNPSSGSPVARSS